MYFRLLEQQSAMKPATAKATTTEQNEAHQGKKVSMNLTAYDMENLEFLTARLRCRNKTEAVGRSLQIVAELMEMIDSNEKLLVEKRNGDLEIIRFVF